jgi:hypothetical protein
MYAVSYSIKYWSKGKVEALFLRHEGYLGAIGAFLKGTEELDCDRYSWQENFAGSSAGLIHVDNQRNSDSDEGPGKLFEVMSIIIDNWDVNYQVISVQYS